jgi:hypothetical protein
MNSGCTFPASFGFAFSNCGQPGHQLLHVGRADVGAVGVAEIDDPVFAVEFGIAALLSILIGQCERSADRRSASGACDSGAAAGRAASGKRKCGDKKCDIFVHGSASHGLLRARIQVCIFRFRTGAMLLIRTKSRAFFWGLLLRRWQPARIGAIFGQL